MSSFTINIEKGPIEYDWRMSSHAVGESCRMTKVRVDACRCRRQRTYFAV
jgi:hypothetical protein